MPDAARNPFPFNARSGDRVRRIHAAEEVFETLAKMILTGELEPHAALPRERDLAAHFSVSPVIVRQAVHRLANIDLVQVRQGGATLVRDPAECDDPQVSVLALRFSPKRGEQLHALRERQIVGSLGLLALAARRCTSDDVVRLQTLIDELRDAPDRIDSVNEAFWTMMADISQNDFFRREARYWFRIARENPGLETRTTLNADQRLVAYQELVTNLATATANPLDRRAAIASYIVSIDTLLDIIDSERAGESV